MDKMKRFFKYAIWIIAFAIFSNILINVGLQSQYNDIKRLDSTSQVEMTEAKATLVNGKIKGIIKNDEENSLNGKYVEIEFYSSRNNEIGKRYVQIQTTKENPNQEFHFYFEKHDVKSYKVEIVDHKEGDEIEIFPKEMTKAEIFVATLLTIMFVA